MRDESHAGARGIFLLILAAMAGGVVGAWVMSMVIDKPADAPEAGRSEMASLSRDLQALAAEMSRLRQSLDAQSRLPTAEQLPDGTATPRPLVATPDTEALLQLFAQAVAELRSRATAGTTSQLAVPPPDPKRRERVLDLKTRPAELFEVVFLRTKQQILDDLGRPDIVYVADQGIERWSWISSDRSQVLALDFHDGHVISFH
jgi:hypothetical protein